MMGRLKSDKVNCSITTGRFRAIVLARHIEPTVCDVPTRFELTARGPPVADCTDRKVAGRDIKITRQKS
jgi:hypothetical protein